MKLRSTISQLRCLLRTTGNSLPSLAYNNLLGIYSPLLAVLRATNCLNGFFMVLIKPSLFPVWDVLTAFSFASAEILSSETFVSLIVILAIVLVSCSVLYSIHILGVGGTIMICVPERTTYELQNLCPHRRYQNSTIFPLFCLFFLLLALFLSFFPSLSFLATGSGGEGGGTSLLAMIYHLHQTHGSN